MLWGRQSPLGKERPRTYRTGLCYAYYSDSSYGLTGRYAGQQANYVSKKPPLDSHLRKLLAKGMQHQQAGQMALAEACYREVLDTEPQCPQALHLLGLMTLRAPRPGSG
jgi:hypothetical protein